MCLTTPNFVRRASLNERTPKLGSAGAPALWDGAVGDPLKQFLLPIGVTTSNLVALCDKGCITHKLQGTDCNSV